MKKCTGCGIKKPLTAFYKDKKPPDGLTFKCKECINKVQQNSKNIKACNIAKKILEHLQTTDDDLTLTEQEDRLDYIVGRNVLLVSFIEGFLIAHD